MTKIRTLTLLSAFAALALTTLDASAQTARVKCETRANRSSASVDGRGLSPGSYSSVLTSGGNTAASPLDISVNGEVQFDYDSNPKDIHKGATPIAPDFISNGKVTGTLLDSNGAVLAVQKAKCKAR